MGVIQNDPTVMGGGGFGFGGFGGGDGGVLSAIILSSLLGRRGGLGGGDECCDDGVRKDIWQGISSIKDSVAQSKDALNERLSDAEGRIVAAAHASEVRDLESRFIVTNRISDLERNVDENFCDVRKEICEVGHDLQKVNTHLTHIIDKGNAALAFQAEKNKGEIEVLIERKFSHAREAELKDELDRERRRNEIFMQNNLFTSQIQAINSNLIDLAQQQKATQQTIQFGAGNIATPANTNTQVRV